MRKDDYLVAAADLNVPPLLIATNDIFTQHKNMLEHCRNIHNGQRPNKEALLTTLDTLGEIVLVSQALVEDMYA